MKSQKKVKKFLEVVISVSLGLAGGLARIAP